MKKPIGGFVALATMALLVTAGSAQAQTSGRLKTAGPARYDTAREVVLEGTVASLVTKPARGMLAGTHVMLNTSKGLIDAHLGTYALRAPGALTFNPGASVKVTGIMTTVQGKPVFLVRTAQTSSGIQVIRNQRGFPLRSRGAALREPDKGKGGRP